MERFFIDPRTLQQKRQGPLGQHIEEFATQPSEQGYSRQCACRQLQIGKLGVSPCEVKVIAVRSFLCQSMSGKRLRLI